MHPWNVCHKIPKPKIFSTYRLIEVSQHSISDHSKLIILSSNPPQKSPKKGKMLWEIRGFSRGSTLGKLLKSWRNIFSLYPSTSIDFWKHTCRSDGNTTQQAARMNWICNLDLWWSLLIFDDLFFLHGWQVWLLDCTIRPTHKSCAVHVFQQQRFSKVSLLNIARIWDILGCSPSHEVSAEWSSSLESTTKNDGGTGILGRGISQPIQWFGWAVSWSAHWVGTCIGIEKCVWSIIH